ncbi:MAG: GDSL-type esterase/lipase family protein [Saprospiraceae bacterium]
MQKSLLYASIGLNLILIAAFLFLIQSLGGFSYLLYKMQNRGVGMVYDHRKSLFTVLETAPASIIFLGNSLTQQCEWAELFNNATIKNRGITGDMTTGVLARLDEIVVTKPTKLFLMIGVNDLLFHRPPIILENYQQILQKIKKASPTTQVYVQSILPVNNALRSTGIKNADIQVLNSGIQALAKAFGFPYLDLYQAFVTTEGRMNQNYTYDGIHLNGAGYLNWKQAIATYVE